MDEVFVVVVVTKTHNIKIQDYLNKFSGVVVTDSVFFKITIDPLFNAVSCSFIQCRVAVVNRI